MRVFQILVSGLFKRLALVLAGGVVVLSACGQRGPLYLPTGEAAAGRATLTEALTPRPAAPASAPAATGTASPIPTQ